MITYGNEAGVVTWKEELGNLPAPVRQMLTQSYHTPDDLVCVVYRLSLTEDRLVLTNVEVAADPIQGCKLAVHDRR